MELVEDGAQEKCLQAPHLRAQKRRSKLVETLALTFGFFGLLQSLKCATWWSCSPNNEFERTEVVAESKEQEK